MRILLLSLCLIIFQISLFSQDSVLLAGLYFNQEPPGLMPKKFAPGIISKDNRNEPCAAYSINGDAFYYEADDTIYYMNYKNEKWDSPQKALFIGNGGKGKYFKISSDGQTFTYGYNGDVYVCKRKDNAWSESEKLPNEINSENFECGVSIANDQTIFFASQREGTMGKCDIFYSEFKDGEYQSPINLDSVNSKGSECGVYVSPKGDFIIHTCFNRAGGYGSSDMYLSFPVDGRWTSPKNIGESINTEHGEWPLFISPDGKYFFFGRNMKVDSKHNIDIYWVDSKAIYQIIEKFKGK